jgi:hypothetical protein
VSTFGELVNIRSTWASAQALLNPRLGELGPILARSVAADPAFRFASALELQLALQTCSG